GTITSRRLCAIPCAGRTEAQRRCRIRCSRNCPHRLPREGIEKTKVFKCGSGEIGRHTILRGWRREAWGFKSPLPHQTESSSSTTRTKVQGEFRNVRPRRISGAHLHQ